MPTSVLRRPGHLGEACLVETRGFADRPRDRGAFYEFRAHNTRTPTSKARFAPPSGDPHGDWGPASLPAHYQL